MKRDTETSITDVGSALTIEDGNIFSNFAGQIYVDYRGLSKYYLYMLLLALLISCVGNIFIYLMSLLPWSRNINDYANYFEPAVAAGVMNAAFIAFGTIYITYYTYMMNGWMIFKDKYFVASIIVHTFLCPLIYSLCIAYKFYVWYYYLDFMYFFVSFLPFSMHSAWITSREKKFTIKYGVAELIVVLSALGYMFLAFPVFLKLSIGLKFFWRLMVHPIIFEFCISTPQRILSKKEQYAPTGCNYFPVLHGVFHSTTIGTMMILMVPEIRYSIALIILCKIEDLLLRITTIKRDTAIIKRIYGDGEWDPKDSCINSQS